MEIDIVRAFHAELEKELRAAVTKCQKIEEQIQHVKLIEGAIESGDKALNQIIDAAYDMAIFVEKCNKESMQKLVDMINSGRVQ